MTDNILKLMSFVINSDDLSKQRVLVIHKKLNELARKAQDAYYNTSKPIMSDSEYDRLYEKIEQLEKDYNINDPNSVTQTAGISEKLEKGQDETHEFPCLSQIKIKHDINKLKEWINDQEAIVSFKEDGLSVVLTYDEGKLTKCVTRGNGKVGRNCTDIMKTQKCLVTSIPEKGHVVVRGEFLITFDEFNRINSKLKDEEKFANPRNLASGVLNQLDVNIGKNRQGVLHIFELAKSPNYDSLKTYEDQLEWCKSQGFEIVKYKKANKSNIEQIVNSFESNIKTEDHPIDGLVCRYNDIAYGDKLGYNNHAPRFSVAYKFMDESVPTKLKNIEFQASRTGRINPVAVFDAIELEGTIVQRCTLNNLSFIEETLGKPYVGQEIYVKKNNKIIPGIDETYTKPNEDNKQNLINIPDKCPSCSHPTKIDGSGNRKFLICDNPNCLAKQSKSIEKFASKSCMDIEGLSTKTIEDFIEAGFITKFSDFYKLDRFKDEIINRDGYGVNSYNKMIDSINKSREVELYRFISALGISNVSDSTAKEICKWFNNDFNAIRNADEDDFMNINGIGMAAAAPLVEYFRENKNEIDELLKYISFKNKSSSSNSNVSNKLQGKSFCITGSLSILKNREQFISLVEANGGTYIGSVKKDLNYLVNNDKTSTSSKNKKAHELNIPIISESDFLNMIG